MCLPFDGHIGPLLFLKRVEKERDNLTETNTRLLRQSAEKDDMNAKSLSTILHLKNLTEQLQQGKLSLEQQLKSAGQLALAARLATNAKDRVAGEMVKEKEVRFFARSSFVLFTVERFGSSFFVLLNHHRRWRKSSRTS